MSWLVPFSALSIDQIRAVEASDDQHRLIVGAPGSGKTLVLLHRAAHLRRLPQTAPNGFKFFVFTRMLKPVHLSRLLGRRRADRCRNDV